MFGMRRDGQFQVIEQIQKQSPTKVIDLSDKSEFPGLVDPKIIQKNQAQQVRQAKMEQHIYGNQIQGDEFICDNPL